MHTFYVPTPQIHTDTATITDSEQHHLRNVLRLTPGATIRIIDGQGNVYTAEVIDIGTNRKPSEARILTHEFHESLLPALTLFQGLPKNDKMELILQKATEIGVTQIVPIDSEHALQKPSQNRYQRWHRVVISATKQCQRTWLPKLCEPQTFEASLTQIDTFSLRLILNPYLAQEPRPQHIKTVLREISQPTSIALFVGPEGGFSEQEVTAAIKNGCVPVTLGTNILRTETAAIVAVAIAAYEYQL
ncbi:16S rRNA (uracil(1498)-N(3))-methyltransferase [Candidatus Poribacteria bacterium]|nr:16S rRNA (uracil(1498)-N(3))-methyltransferase [Candidatus Poribacteria bacterium]MYA72780.1 16S rRNA (uracil(1498)-N(3))-methyltransferase [Candidatus Poribacteria bacterium]MYH82299.1 16S rRNA (uracil(1498)-N(3))-methyltransferase [Candidatus Poribacteria bacterium]MYK92520.1 16S rRNA (uracil(1498)-N(3))-methyltransferase [Candidatus Poribacteria bacterium]